MTIASAFNDITEKLGGTPSNSGTIASAIDALNDVLAGSDQPAAQTIEGAVALLGEHIGGGSSVTVEALTATENKTYTAPEGKAYSPVTVNVSGAEYDIHCYLDNEGSYTPIADSVGYAIWSDDDGGYWDLAPDTVNKSEAGKVLTFTSADYETILVKDYPLTDSAKSYNTPDYFCIMPNRNVSVILKSPK